MSNRWTNVAAFVGAVGLIAVFAMHAASLRVVRALQESSKQTSGEMLRLGQRIDTCYDWLAQVDSEAKAIQRDLAELRRRLANSRPRADSSGNTMPPSVAEPIGASEASPWIATTLDYTNLTEQEIEYFTKHRPGDDSILFRGSDGRVGVLQMYGSGGRLDAQSLLENQGKLVTDLANAITDLEEMRERLIEEAVGRGEGKVFDSIDDARVFAAANFRSGAYFMDRNGETVVLDFSAIDEQRELASQRDYVNMILANFGDGVGYTAAFVDTSQSSEGRNDNGRILK